MGMRNPEDWLPEYELSEQACIRASVTMAQFCVLAWADPDVALAKKAEVTGCFVTAAKLSTRGDNIEQTMQVDLGIAGLDDETAAEWAAQLGSASMREWVASGMFIDKNRPDYGLYKNRRHTEEPTLIKKIIKLSNRSR